MATRRVVPKTTLLASQAMVLAFTVQTLEFVFLKLTVHFLNVYMNSLEQLLPAQKMFPLEPLEVRPVFILAICVL